MWKNVGRVAVFHDQLREAMLIQHAYLIKCVLMAIINAGAL